jgi:adenylylsulfate kinase-like enzyme
MHSTILWLFGLPCSGKTTLALELQKQLKPEPCIILDGDAYRAGVSKDLGYSYTERMENLRRAAETALLIANQGVRVICSFVTPEQEHRNQVTKILADKVRWLHLECPIAVCQKRDTKGMYARSLQRLMPDMTGVQAPFDPPAPSIISVSTHELDLPTSVALALQHWQRSKPNAPAQ